MMRHDRDIAALVPFVHVHRHAPFFTFEGHRVLYRQHEFIVEPDIDDDRIAFRAHGYILRAVIQFDTVFIRIETIRHRDRF